MRDTRVKFISEIETDLDHLEVKDPFQLRQESQRRFIRLEISEPIKFSLIKDKEGPLQINDEIPEYQGSILNLSAGGVLISANEPLEEGSLVNLEMILQNVETVDQVIGLVKRADSDEESWLIGIEFLSRERLEDFLGAAELDLLPDNLSTFDERIRQVLNKYVYNRKVAGVREI